MQIEYTRNDLNKISTDALLVFTYQDITNKITHAVPTNACKTLDGFLHGEIKRIAELEKFTGKRGEVISIYPENKIVATRVILLGLGKKDEFVADDMRRAVASFVGRIKKKYDSLVVVLPTENEGPDDLSLSAQLVVEGVIFGAYEFGQYKEKEKDVRELQTLIFAEPDEKQLKRIKDGVKIAQLYTEATILARDLINEQPAVATPTYLAKLAQEIAKSSPQITCKIIDKAEAEKLGMHAFLGIARAADTPPKFIHLEYKPTGKSKEKIAIVGKGITFDSGGISLKPANSMMTMKMDMSGAALVLGVFSVIAKVKPNRTVMGLIAATPNLVSGSSIVPGDVVKAMNGKSIEVLNTDAEGRVTMADSLSYALRHKADKIIDFATLTGACEVALGPQIAGLFSNNRDFTEAIKAAAYTAGEKVWELPLEKDYKEMNKSEVADIANIANTPYGGAITAGLFLEEFVENTVWAHLDIAGPAFAERPIDISPKGGTGFGVRTVLNLISG